MVRSGSSMYIINTCGDRKNNPLVGDFRDENRKQPQVKMYNCEEGKRDMAVQVNGNKYTVILPSFILGFISY